MGREIRVVGGYFLEAGRRDFLDRQRVQGACEVSGNPQCLGGTFAFAPDQSRERQLPSKGLNRRRHRLPGLGGIEGAADAVIEVGVADGDQARQDQSAPAGANEGLGQGAHGAVVGEQDAAAGESERVAAMLPHQPRDQ